MKLIAMPKGEIYVLMQLLRRSQIERDPALIWQELLEMFVEPLGDKHAPPRVVPSELDARHGSEYTGELDE
jgi:hypothetical protein